MQSTRIKDIAERARLTEDELTKVVGGIETIPLPEIAQLTSIGTWPTPERPTTSQPSLEWVGSSPWSRR